MGGGGRGSALDALLLGLALHFPDTYASQDQMAVWCVSPRPDAHGLFEPALPPSNQPEAISRKE